MTTFEIASSNGTLTAFAETGEVLSCECDEGNELAEIRAFDVREYKKNHNEIPDSIDILNLGFWYDRDGNLAYEKAAI